MEIETRRCCVPSCRSHSGALRFLRTEPALREAVLGLRQLRDEVVDRRVARLDAETAHTYLTTVEEVITSVAALAQRWPVPADR
jgi:hypothetical protein